MLWLPDEPFEPLHEPPAVHDDGLLVALHAIVAAPPVVMEAGESDTDTTGIAITVSTADAAVLPAAFAQVKV